MQDANGSKMSHQRPATMTLNLEVIGSAMKAKKVYTYKALAELLGVSYATVKRQCSGGEVPTATVLAGLHVRLGLKLSDAVIVVDPEQVERRRVA